MAQGGQSGQGGGTAADTAAAAAAFKRLTAPGMPFAGFFGAAQTNAAASADPDSAAGAAAAVSGPAPAAAAGVAAAQPTGDVSAVLANGRPAANKASGSGAAGGTSLQHGSLRSGVGPSEDGQLPRGAGAASATQVPAEVQNGRPLAQPGGAAPGGWPAPLVTPKVAALARELLKYQVPPPIRPKCAKCVSISCEQNCNGTSPIKYWRQLPAAFKIGRMGACNATQWRDTCHRPALSGTIDAKLEVKYKSEEY